MWSVSSRGSSIGGLLSPMGGMGGRKKLSSSGGGTAMQGLATNRNVSRKAMGHDMWAYAQSLGIDPVKDSEFVWIAEEAFQAQLPPGWSEHLDDDGCMFYYNQTSGDSSWTHPMDDIFRQIVVYQRTVLDAGGFWQVDDELAEVDEAVSRGLSEWKELYDEDMERFYYNKESKESRLDDPRPINYHLLRERTRMVQMMKQRFPHEATWTCPIRTLERRVNKTARTHKSVA